MRFLKLSALLALPVAFAVTLGAVPQTAEAGLCKRLGTSNNCVTTADVKNNNLKANDLKDEPGAAFIGGDQSFGLTGSNASVRTVTLVAPRAGVVIVTASGEFFFGGGNQIVHCAISTTTGLDGAADFRAENESLISFLPFSSTRAFVVPAGSFTVRLVCHEDSGTTISVRDSTLTALYVPTQY